jgi:hypothetical protein
MHTVGRGARSSPRPCTIRATPRSPRSPRSPGSPGSLGRQGPAHYAGRSEPLPLQRFWVWLRMPGRADNPRPHLKGGAGVRSSAPRQADGFEERPWFGFLHRSYLDFRRVRFLRHPRSSRVYPVSTAIGLWSLLLLSAQPRLSDGKPTRTAGPPGPRTGSGAAELRITRVSPCGGADNRCSLCAVGWIRTIDLGSRHVVHVHDWCDGCSWRLCTRSYGQCTWQNQAG